MSEDNKKPNEPDKKPSQELSAEDLKKVAGGTDSSSPVLYTKTKISEIKIDTSGT